MASVPATGGGEPTGYDFRDERAANAFTAEPLSRKREVIEAAPDARSRPDPVDNGDRISGATSMLSLTEWRRATRDGGRPPTHGRARLS